MWVVLYFYPKDFTSGCMGNPVEDERDSGLKPNTIPL
jgi:hypothetical protein